MDAYLFRFEMMVKTLNWDDKAKFIALSNLLSGESLKVLHALSESQHNYTALKQALLRRYQFTESDYNKKFREATPQPEEDVDSFISRLESLFDKWIELAEVPLGDFDKLRQLMIKDQTYRSLNPHIVTFLKERSPKNLSQIRTLGNQYKCAHPERTISKTETSIANVGFSGDSNMSKKNKWQDMTNTCDNRDRSSRPRQRRSFSCAPGLDRSDRSWSPHDANPYNRQYAHNYEPRGFFHSRGRNHFRGQPNRRNNRNRARSYNRRGAHDRQVSPFHKRTGYANFAQDGSMGQTVSACSGQSQANVLTIFKGTCNDYPCSVLRDTGSSCIGICRKFIKPIDYTGNKAKCMMFNGQVVELETAYATIYTPFYSG